MIVLYNYFQMNKFHKRPIFLILIFAFSSALIFCCDFEEVRASMLPHSGHDQSEHGQDQSADHHCLSQQTFIADFPKSFNVQLAFSHFLKGFFKDGMMLASLLDVSSLSQTVLLVDRSPPSLVAPSIPIYRKIPNLRL